MIDTIKKTLLAGLGATVITAERVEQAMGDLIEKGKLNAEEAREVANNVVEQGKEEWENSRQELAETMNDFLKEANVATRDALSELSKRIDDLEERLAAKAED
ncbi:MAG: hypothetical protein P8L44_21635 [Opitutales bacterium]|nr:hypothetical protein [Opitutales bacterium]